MCRQFLIDILIVLMFLVIGSVLYTKVNYINPFHVVDKYLGIVNAEK